MREDRLVSLTVGEAAKSLAACVLFKPSMIRTIAVMPGRASFNLGLLRAAASEFGWGLRTVESLSTSVSVGSGEKLAAVLFHRSAFESSSWLDALGSLMAALPGVRPIACHEFSDAPDWPELSSAGAFHSLWLPLKEEEVRQSLGFIAEAESRESEASRRLPVIVPALHRVRRPTTGSSRHIRISRVG